MSNLKKILFINWKFQTEYREEWEVQNNKDCRIICYNSNDVNTVSNKINGLKSESILILLHKNSPNGNVTKEKLEPTLALKNKKVRPFGGGSDAVYLVKGQGLLAPNGDTLHKLCLDNSLIKETNFNDVWDYYWNKLDLEYQKKNIINLWLPLAIDIQGLSEVEESKESKRKTYLDEVLEELDKKENGKSYYDILIEGWNEVKKILLPEDGKQVLEEKYQIKGEEINKVKFPIECEKDDKGNYKIIELNTLKSFIKENYKDKNNPNFLPNWLQAVVNVIDEKLKQNS